jgi:hypothetical protein
MTILCELAKKYGTDKVTHRYTTHYHNALEAIRNRENEPVKILEIGIWKGASLLMWEEYFPNGKIYGIDNGHHASIRWDYDGHRIQTLKAEQTDRKALLDFAREFGPFDLIVDDGAHTQSAQQVSFGCLIPHVSLCGRYIIEDLATPYNWAKEGFTWGRIALPGFRDSTLVQFYDWKEGFTENYQSRYMTREENDWINSCIGKDDCKIIYSKDETSDPYHYGGPTTIIVRK